MPNVERFCTYTQSVDYVRRHCSFLSAAEKEMILGANVDRLLGIGERCANRRGTSGAPSASADAIDAIGTQRAPGVC